jgi:hypothetical protein
MEDSTGTLDFGGGLVAGVTTMTVEHLFCCYDIGIEYVLVEVPILLSY